MPASANFYSAEYKYRLLEVQHWWFINNGPCETFFMLEMRSIRLALVHFVTVSSFLSQYFCVGSKAFANVGWIYKIF